MIDFYSSLEILRQNISQWQMLENIAITEANGRILATDIKAKNNYPKFQTASMDGFAVRFCDLKEGVKFKLIGQTPAGKMPDAKISQNECVKTFTGAILCENADTILPVENIEISSNSEILVREVVAKNFAVRKIGESYKKNEILLSKGTKLDFASIALLAELGIFSVSVFARPKVAILSTGSELKDLGEVLENEAQIHSCNHIALANLVRNFGGEAVILPLLKDEKEKIQNAVLNALKFCDILITTGGVSVGDYDFLRDFMPERFEILIDKVAVKPGRHIKIAKFGEKFIFALPGFSVSAVVMSFLYVRFLFDLLLCQNENHEISAILAENFTKKSKFLEFAPANLSFENGKILVSTNGKKSGSSAIISNLIDACLLICPLEKTELKKGEIVQVLLLK